MIATSEEAEGLLVDLSTYVWTPSAALQAELPANFKIVFDAVEAPDGQRRFLPAGSLGVYEPHAWAAGLAVLIESMRLSDEEVFSYRAMHLIFGRAQHMHAHLDRAFSSPADLTVRRSGRGAGVDATILPDSLGKDSAGKGRRWSVTRLLEEGRARAKQEGLNRCPQAHAIAYGLLVAAERNPLEMADTEAAALVRMALFNCEAQEATLSREIIKQVEERLLVAFKAHQDDTQEAFDKWYRGGRSNLPKSLANQAGAAGGRLDDGLVQGSLLELTWRSYQYESNCLNMFAQAFMQALPHPLSPVERSFFAQMYQPQAYLGGLPLALVLERSVLLQPVLMEIWESPGDRNLWKILWRLLQYYSEMASSRRRADRQSKAKPVAPSAGSRSLGNSLNLAEMAEELGVGAGVSCKRRDCQLDFNVDINPDTKRAIVITARCKKHGPLPPIKLTSSEAKAILDRSGNSFDI